MHNLGNQPRIILIGGTSHTGKSTLGKALALKLGGEYIATDNLARHPGRPWIVGNNQTIKPHVVEHYLSLSAPQLLEDVLIHYHQNVIPQVKDLVEIHNGDNHLIVEGSALYPILVRDIVSDKNVRGIWLTGNYSLFKKRIFANSNFDRVSKQERYLIDKFLQRTWMYDRAMVNDLKTWGSKSIQLNCNMTTTELKERCLAELENKP